MKKIKLILFLLSGMGICLSGAEENRENKKYSQMILENFSITKNSNPLEEKCTLTITNVSNKVRLDIDEKLLSNKKTIFYIALSEDNIGLLLKAYDPLNVYNAPKQKYLLNISAEGRSASCLIESVRFEGFHVERVHFDLANINKMKGIIGTLVIEDSQRGFAKFTPHNELYASSFCKIMLSPDTIQVLKNQCKINEGSIKNPLYHLLLRNGTLYTPNKIQILK